MYQYADEKNTVILNRMQEKEIGSFSPSRGYPLRLNRNFLTFDWPTFIVYQLRIVNDVIFLPSLVNLRLWDQLSILVPTIFAVILHTSKGKIQIVPAS